MGLLLGIKSTGYERDPVTEFAQIRGKLTAKKKKKKSWSKTSFIIFIDCQKGAILKWWTTMSYQSNGIFYDPSDYQVRSFESDGNFSRGCQKDNLRHQ